MLKKGLTLSDKIVDLLNTTPASVDPEDITFDDTTAKLQEQHCQNNEENDNEDEILSSFRKQNVNFLSDIDERYSGKKGSRKSLRKLSESSNENSNEENSGDEDMEESDSNSVENSESDRTDNELNLDESIFEEKSFQHIKESDDENHIKKGNCVRNQISIWESLLEMRIQMQKCLLNANKMPQSNVYNEMKLDKQFSNKITDTRKCVSSLLDKLLLLQTLVRKQYPETKTLGKDSKNEDSDEEILSDTEDEEHSEEESNDNIPTKKLKIDQYENEIYSRHKTYSEYRNGVIKKWNDKTRLTVGKSNMHSHSILEQIQHNLNDKPRLIKKTQMKRSNYKIIGQPGDSNEECNSEIFDDDDFYHQLLRELIEVKSANVTDPVQLSRQWIQLQNMRSKMKRKIDTRATKGRKIRFGVHNKLVNYMAPIEDNSFTEEGKTELYSSLFGKNN